MADSSYQPKVYRQAGGERMVVASSGSLDVESGGEIDIESGGYLKLAGTAITATAAQLNAMAAGTGTTSATFIIDSDSSGAKLKFDTNSATGDYTASVVPPSLTGNITLTLPNATSTLSGLGLVETFSGIKTFTAVPVVAIDDANNTAVTDVITLTKTTSGAPGAGIGAGISVIIENDSDATTQSASIDFVETTDGTKANLDTDMVVSTMLAGTVTEGLRLDASDQSLTIGRNATDANGVNKFRIFPLTTASGSVVIQATANTGDTATTITNAAMGQASTITIPDPGDAAANFVLSKGTQTLAGTYDISGATVTYRAIVNADIAAGAAIVRSKLAEDALQRYPIPLTLLRKSAGAAMVDDTLADDEFALALVGWGTGTLTMVTNSAQNNTKTATALYEFCIPPEYVAAGDVRLVVQAKSAAVAGGGTISGTVDAEVYKLGDDGTASADLNETAAQATTASFADYTFTITSTNLVAGDRLMVCLRATCTEAADSGTAATTVGSAEIQLDIKG